MVLIKTNLEDMNNRWDTKLMQRPKNFRYFQSKGWVYFFVGVGFVVGVLVEKTIIN